MKIYLACFILPDQQYALSKAKNKNRLASYHYLKREQKIALKQTIKTGYCGNFNTKAKANL